MPFFVHIFAAIEQMLHLIVFACCHSKLRSAANQDPASAQSMQMSIVNKQEIFKGLEKSDGAGADVQWVRVCLLKPVQPLTNISQIITDGKIQAFENAECHIAPLALSLGLQSLSMKCH